MSFKDTLNLPKTTFPMKGKLPKNEPAKYKKWHDDDVCDRMDGNRSGEDTFVLHDGPPYANGNIHIGHALNKILKDFIVKFNYFQGKRVDWRPGWDCHGLPIERDARKKAKSPVAADVIEECGKHAKQWVQEQSKQFQALGCMADWDFPYTTMGMQHKIYESLCKLMTTGKLYQEEKPVHWSWAERTALAEAEVEYKDRTDTAIYVMFPSTGLNPLVVNDERIDGLLVWTTTPWTLPSNVAIAVNPGATYVVATVPDLGMKRPDGSKPEQKVLVSQNAFQDLVQKGVIRDDPGYCCLGSDLEEKVVSSPLVLAGRPLVMDHRVETDKGTGFIHIAPGHGDLDYDMGKKHNLPTVMPVDENGCYTEEINKLIEFILFDGRIGSVEGNRKRSVEYIGVNVFEANKMLIKDLEMSHYLAAKEEITHSYPHCWRSRKPLIFRATPQWFLDLTETRSKAPERLKNVEFHPERGRDHLAKMVAERPFWCISRQRVWGVPIAFVRDKETKEVLGNEEILKHIATMFEYYGIKCWRTCPIEFFLPPEFQDQADQLEKVEDILDVWFDSGLTWKTNLHGSADVVVEGHDQYRGWFQSSLILSDMLSGTVPYKSVITHGFVLDSNGEKMAKSRGNVVSPESVLKEHGSEILRMWVAMTDYTKDMRISDEVLKGASEVYRKIRNSFRYLLANLSDREKVPVRMICQIDEWIARKTRVVCKEVNEHFAKHEFYTGIHKLSEFMTNDLSSVYMYAVKDRLYCDAKDSARRESAQTACWQVLCTLQHTLAPILTYTMDEVMDHAPEWHNKGKDIFDIEDYPAGFDTMAWKLDEVYWKKVLNKYYHVFDSIKHDTNNDVSEFLDVVISPNEKVVLFSDAADWFGVSDIRRPIGDPLRTFEVDGLTYLVFKADKNKCERCWKRNADENLCPRCEKVTNEISTVLP